MLAQDNDDNKNKDKKKSSKKSERESKKRVASDDEKEIKVDETAEEENIPTKKVRRNVIESDEDE